MNTIKVGPWSNGEVLGTYCRRDAQGNVCALVHQVAIDMWSWCVLRGDGSYRSGAQKGIDGTMACTFADIALADMGMV